LLDWGAPAGDETRFTVAEYVTRRLGPALEAAVALAGGPVAMVGYCMGGMLAVAAAGRWPERVAALALLATPWDFATATAGGASLRALAPLLEAQIAATGVLPVDALQACFAALQPLRVVDKFRAFSRLDGTSEAALRFVQIEDWLNDGVPLAGPVARECLLDWYGENTPGRGRWRVDGAAVSPAAVAAPTLVLVPERDRIVPAASALALAEAIPGAEHRLVGAGHIGMVVGAGAEAECWRPLADWLDKVLPRGIDKRRKQATTTPGRAR